MALARRQRHPIIIAWASVASSILRAAPGGHARRAPLRFLYSLLPCARAREKDKKTKKRKERAKKEEEKKNIVALRSKRKRHRKSMKKKMA